MSRRALRPWRARRVRCRRSDPRAATEIHDHFPLPQGRELDGSAAALAEIGAGTGGRTPRQGGPDLDEGAGVLAKTVTTTSVTIDNDSSGNGEDGVCDSNLVAEGEGNLAQRELVLI